MWCFMIRILSAVNLTKRRREYFCESCKMLSIKWYHWKFCLKTLNCNWKDFRSYSMRVWVQWVLLQIRCNLGIITKQNYLTNFILSMLLICRIWRIRAKQTQSYVCQQKQYLNMESSYLICRSAWQSLTLKRFTFYVTCFLNPLLLKTIGLAITFIYINHNHGYLVLNLSKILSEPWYFK